MLKRVVFLLFVFAAVNGFGQVITWSPQYPTVNDSVTITFNASQGNGALNGIEPVYAHTGLITSLSTTPSDWWYKKANWFDGHDSTIQMTKIANNQHQSN